MKITYLIALTICGSFATGCMSTAKRPLVASEILQFKENQTQKSDVIEYYGEPQSEGISGNLQNVCYFSMSGGNKLLFMQFNDKGLLVTKNFEDKKAREECASVIPAPSAPSHFAGSSIGGTGSSHCTIPDGTDQYGRPKTRCPEDSSSASRNFGANTGQNCNIFDGTDSYGRPKYRCM